ncbi:MAG TPA: tRNA (5-methylaminomethyl-2-thiouridine)(34)-methyltransferase MnmD [Bacteroidales bacterium]|nr:tRNA (5-methylaminomethyl-2-thiouridine)(34)-methyltransferase MnmD [Bacteroidales bacterium]HQN14829.1 tRNA (5-methylaminomethyl-2-thiouridine)(34)-methyltransferase MnmD [Bacteroidales bacterium]
MESKIIMTADGSQTIFIPELNECYHSRNGAITESAHIFINAGFRLAAQKNEALNILEVGFGTGLNALLTLIEANKTKRDVFYVGVEPDRVDKKMLTVLNYPLLMAIPNSSDYFYKIHNTTSQRQISDYFSLSVHEEKIQEIPLGNSFFHLVYFDAFAPAICPELWNVAVFQKLWNSLTNDGILVTYSCKGEVKRALKAVGFSIEKLPGPPGKREFIRATKKR